MQCDNCKRWFHSMCTNLTPAAYKRCCRPIAHWLCNNCCSSTKVRITEAITLLNGALLLDSKTPIRQENSCCSDIDDTTEVINTLQQVLDESLSSEALSLKAEVSHDADRTLTEVNDCSLPSTPKKKKRTRGRKPEDTVSSIIECHDTPAIQVELKQPIPKIDSEEGASGWSNVVSRKKRDSATKKDVPPNKNGKSLSPQAKKAHQSKPDLSDRSLILHKVEESEASDPRTRFEHDLNLVKPILDKLLPTTVTGITIHSLYRIGQKAESTANQSTRLLKVVLNSKAERDAILSNSQILKGSGTYIRADLCLADRIKRQSAALELSERRRNGEKNLTIKGFRVIKVRSLMIPKPMWVERGSTKQN